MQYIILLRGINVGGRNLKMPELRSCFEKAGYSGVITVLQTGNVILESKEKNAEKLREQATLLLSRTFNYPATALVITPEQLQAVIQNYPFSTDGPEFHRYAVFTEGGFEKELVKQAGDPDKTMEAVQAGKGVVYWRVLKGHTLDSAFGKQLAKAAVRHFVTNRNLNTLEKIMKAVVMRDYS